jgi:hypothetical protein
LLGILDGDWLGLALGILVGADDGATEGGAEIKKVGLNEGTTVGDEGCIEG